MMRFYIYNLLITFDIKIFKLIKNSLIFSALGIGRNLLALFGIGFLTAFHVFLIVLMEVMKTPKKLLLFSEAKNFADMLNQRRFHI